jgi:hypothetical protein
MLMTSQVAFPVIPWTIVRLREGNQRLQQQVRVENGSRRARRGQATGSVATDAV